MGGFGKYERTVDVKKKKVKRSKTTRGHSLSLPPPSLLFFLLFKKVMGLCYAHEKGSITAFFSYYKKLLVYCYVKYT